MGLDGDIAMGGGGGCRVGEEEETSNANLMLMALGNNLIIRVSRSCTSNNPHLPLIPSSIL